MSIIKNPGPTLYFSQYGGEQPIPPEFIAAMNRREEVTAVASDVPPESLSGEIVESKVETNRTDERVRRTVKKDAGNIVLRAIRTNDQGQPVQVTLTLFPTGTAPGVPTATTNVAVKDLGNGWSLQEVGVEGTYVGGVFTPGIFTGNKFEKEIRDNVPPEFSVLIPISEQETNVEGIAVDPTLTTGDLARSEQQITSFVKRTMRRFRAAVSGASLSEGDLYEGIPTTITKTFATSIQTVSATLLKIRERVLNLGDGTSVKESVTVASYPQRQGQQYDENLDKVIPYTIDRVAMGTGIGTNRKEITPVDFNKADVRTIDPSSFTTALNAYMLEFPGTTNLDLPDQLIAVAVTLEKSMGSGEYNAAPAVGTVTEGRYHISSRGTGQGSASIMPTILPYIKQNWARNVPTKHWFFYLPSPVNISAILTKCGGAVQTWPKFKPQSAMIVGFGERISLQVNADAELDLNVTDIGDFSLVSSGAGFSKEFSQTIVSVNIPPTIHGAISISGTTTDSQDVTVSASADAYLVASNPSPVTGTVTGAITSAGLGATSGTTTIPASGVYLLDSHCEPYKFGYVRVHAETVDFADV